LPKTFLAPQGYTWDYISWKMYGDEGFIHTLLAANPELRHIVLFDVPVTINVPDRPATRAASSINLPPWKQQV